MSSDVEETDDLDIIHDRGSGDENAEDQVPENVHQEEAEEDNTQNDDEAEEAPQPKVEKVKRVIRNPQIKLNHMTLRGARGLSAIPEIFKKQKFKGRGHEEGDLRTLLKTYEYWCHRMFPKYPFDECIEKIERLGSKKMVMTYIKRIRMGLEDEISEQIKSQSEDEDDVVNIPEKPKNDDARFDALIDRPAIVELSEEQLEQIRISREMAVKRRQDRLKQIQQQAESKLMASNTLTSEEIIMTGGSNLHGTNESCNLGQSENMLCNENQEVAAQEHNETDNNCGDEEICNSESNVQDTDKSCNFDSSQNMLCNENEEVAAQEHNETDNNRDGEELCNSEIAFSGNLVNTAESFNSINDKHVDEQSENNFTLKANHAQGPSLSKITDEQAEITEVTQKTIPEGSSEENPLEMSKELIMEWN